MELVAFGHGKAIDYQGGCGLIRRISWGLVWPEIESRSVCYFGAAIYESFSNKQIQ